MVMSAVSSVRTPGVLVTVMPLSVAALTSILSTPGAEIGDQLEIGARLGDQGGVDAVGDGGHQHIGRGHGFCKLCSRHRHIVMVEARIEQLAHARFHRFRQLAGDDDKRLLGHAGSPRRMAPLKRKALDDGSGHAC